MKENSNQSSKINLTIVEGGLFILFAIGVLFKFLMYPGAAILILFSMSALGFIYFTLLAKLIRKKYINLDTLTIQSDNDKSSLDVDEITKKIGEFRLTVGLGSGLAIICIGIATQLNNYFNLKLFLQIGIILTSTIIGMLYYYKNNFEIPIFNKLINKGFFFLILGVGILLFEKQRIEIIYKNKPLIIKAYSEYSKMSNRENLLKFKKEVDRLHYDSLLLEEKYKKISEEYNKVK